MLDKKLMLARRMLWYPKYKRGRLIGRPLFKLQKLGLLNLDFIIRNITLELYLQYINSRSKIVYRNKQFGAGR